METRKDPNKPWYESSGLSPREGSTQSKSRTKCTGGWSNGYFEPHPRQRSFRRVHLANASVADLTVWRNRDTISFYVVPPRTSAGNERSGICSRIAAVFVTRVKCLHRVWFILVREERSLVRRTKKIPDKPSESQH